MMVNGNAFSYPVGRVFRQIQHFRKPQNRFLRVKTKFPINDRVLRDQRITQRVRTVRVNKP